MKLVFKPNSCRKIFLGKQSFYRLQDRETFQAESPPYRETSELMDLWVQCNHLDRNWARRNVPPSSLKLNFPSLFREWSRSMAEGFSDTDPAQPIPMIDLKAQHQTIARDVMQAVDAVFESQGFVMGESVSNFEEAVAKYCDSRHAIGCASGTDALILALMALDIGPGAEVITTPFSFFATASSIARVGAKPVFVDIDPVSFNLDPALIEAAITPRTKAIMPVHLFGQCVEMDPVWRIATQHGIPIVEDACQAIGSEYQGRRAGVLGRMGCFSFFPTKNLGGAGDGGLITTDDPELAKRVKHLRVHGDVGRYEHVEVGLNSRLDALQAAVLHVKLRSLDEWTKSRQENAARYCQLFEQAGLLDALELPQELPHRRHIYNQYCIRVKNGRRDEVLSSLHQQKIGAAVYYPKPLHIQPCFASLGYRAGDFPISEGTSEEVLALPIYAELTAGQQETVVRGISRGLGQNSAGSGIFSRARSSRQHWGKTSRVTYVPLARGFPDLARELLPSTLAVREFPYSFRSLPSRETAAGHSKIAELSDGDSPP